MIDRFRSLIEELHLSPSEFADRIGVQRSSVSHVLSGRNKPSIDFLEKILNTFPEIDTTWLITGRAKIKTNLTTVNPKIANDQVQQEISLKDKISVKSQAPSVAEPVEQIIIVYRNNTFRIIKPSEK